MCENSHLKIRYLFLKKTVNVDSRDYAGLGSMADISTTARFRRAKRDVVASLDPVFPGASIFGVKFKRGKKLYSWDYRFASERGGLLLLAGPL